MSSYTQAYSDAVVRYAELTKSLRERKDGLRRLAASRPPQGQGDWKSEDERVTHSGNALIAKDPECQDLQTQLDRTAQEAIMWGIGGLLERPIFPPPLVSRQQRVK
jgi:hypothetical protein